ncbi:MAG: hypothetical protein Kow0089_01350 [Desulfobulbaceae bacterium]
MRKWIYAGTVLLVVQVVLAVLVHSGREEMAAFTPHANLLDFDPHTVDVVIVTGEDEKTVRLVREGNYWRFPEDHFGAPADGKKITDLLEKLGGLKQGLAVATTTEAAERFKVAEDAFQRHVVLEAGGKTVADFYLGTAPSFKKAHARVHDRNEIVTVELNTYELETDYDRWLDHDLLTVEKDKAVRVRVNDLVLEKKEGKWILADLAAGETMQEREADGLVERVCGLTVAGVVDPAEAKGLFDKEPELRLEVTVGDTTSSWELAKPEGQEYYLLRTKDRPYYLKVNTWVVDAITKTDRQALVTKQEEQAGEKTAPAPAAEQPAQEEAE